jgi:deoxyribonuclease-4
MSSTALPPIGGHVSAVGGLAKAVDRAQVEGFDALQLFTQSPRAWKATAHPEEAVTAFKTSRKAAGIRYVACHALYLINLASADADLCQKSAAALVATVAAAVAIDADAVVLHVGSHGGDGFPVGLERCLAPLRRALDACHGPTQLLLESSAGAGGTIGRTVAELTEIIGRLEGHSNYGKVGICLDSCHLYASGIDVSAPAAVAALVTELERGVGLERVRLLHVNDSQGALGSNRDRHANILEGLIGADLRHFVSHPDLRQLPALLETPGVNKKGPNRHEGEKLRALYSAT